MIAAIKGAATEANSGVYTAYLCSAGKYSSASIPGLKNAREARVNASLEWCRADIKEDEPSAKTCQSKVSASEDSEMRATVPYQAH